MGRTVLVVRDSNTGLMGMTAFLKKEYDIIEAFGGEDAISLLRKKYKIISAIILDIVMPGADGFDVLKKIRQNMAYQSIPIIITASNESENVHEKAIALGANGFVTKPLSHALLLNTLQNSIRLRETAAMLNTFWRDKLTGLLNREAFFGEAERLIKSHEPGYYVLSCMDIDNFKLINDQYGTSVGDKVLLHVGVSINGFVAGINGISCRFSADRFAVLYPASLIDCDEILENHREVINPSCISRSIRIRIGRYIVNDPGLSVSTMYDRATLAEESIKGQYNTYVSEYSEIMRDDLVHEQKIVNNMEDALRKGEFIPWFQPQYNHATGALIGAEALVRWEHNGRLISPGEFVPIFERNGFIYEVDQSIWEQVCRILRRWLDEGKSPLPVSVNISRRDLFHRHFIPVFTGIVKKYNIPYDLIRLEVTESAFAEASGHIIAKVNDLIDLGFTVEIDDFGSGYSSLNTLKDVPASILKLDMKFFENTKNHQRGGNIVESVVRMAKWLGMAVIAEGVEDKAQADYLKSIGCHYIQGYYYARPMSVEQYEELVEKSQSEPKLTRLETLKTLDNNEFWNPQSMETLVFNNYVGGACIFEYHRGKMELLRVNEQYEHEIKHFTDENALSVQASPLKFMDEENARKFRYNIQKIVRTKKVGFFELKLCHKGKTEYFRLTARVIARAGGRYLFYCVIVNITQQREAERKQLQSAQQLAIIMENINGGVSAILINDDATSKLVFSNDKYYALFGYSRQEAEEEKLDVLSLVLPEDLPYVMEKVRKLKEDGKPTIIDYRCKKRDGTLAYMRVNSSLMSMDGYGDVITSVVTDITETRTLEEQLHTIIDNINGGVTATVIRNGEPEFVVVNDQYFNMLGYSNAEEFEKLGLDKYAGLHPHDRERIIKQFETSDGGKKRYTMEYRIIRTDGEVRYISNNISVVNLFGVEQPVQLSVANDVTDTVQAQLKEKETSDKLSAVLSHAGNGITAIVLRENTPYFLFSNDKYFEMVGYTQEEYVRVTENDMFAAVHPQDRERLRAIVTQLNKQQGSDTLEYRVIRSDKSIVWIKSVITITSLAGIDELVQISIFSDITAEKEASEQLKFLNSSAHDILAQPDSEVAIGETLENLMKYFRGDRAYVIEIDNGRKVSNNTYEVCKDGVASEKDMLQDVPFSVSEYWFETLNKNEFIVIEDVAKLDDNKAELRSLLLQQDIKSIIITPLWRDGVLVGFAGVDNPTHAVNQLEKLKALADYIAILLTRRDLSRKIEHDNETMQQMMNDTPGGFLRIEIQKNATPAIVNVNTGFCKMLDMTYDEVMKEYGMDAYKCLFADDVASVKEEATQAFERSGQFTCKCRLYCKNGDALWVMAIARFVKNESGQLFINSYFTDISQEKKEQEHQIELLDNLPTGAALYEYDGHRLAVIHINKTYWELVDREPSDYSKASVFGMVHDEDRLIAQQEIESAIRQERNISVDLRIRCHKYSYRPFHITAKFTGEKNGKYLLYAVYTPISEQKMSVQEMLPVALSTMLSVSEELSYVKDKNLNYICCSESMAKMIGADNTNDIIGKTDYDLFDKNIAQEFISRDKRIIEYGESLVDYKEKVPDENGIVRHVSTSKYPIMDSLGNVIGIYGISRDITLQRKRESQLKLLTNSIPGGLAAFIYSENKYKLDYYNNKFCTLFGYDRKSFSLSVEQLMDMIFDEDREMVDKQLEELIKDETPIDCVYRIHTRGGGYRWLSHKAAIAENNGDTVSVNAVFLDVTEQQEEKERLRISEELNRLAIELSGNIITRFDVKKRTLTLPDSFNPIFVLPHVLYNMPQEQIDLGRISPDTADAYSKMFEEITRGSMAGSTSYKQNSSKGWRWLEAQYTTVFSSNGEPVSAVISFTDITEKLEKEVVYNKWQQSLDERCENSYALLRCNLSKCTPFDSWEGSLLKVKIDKKFKTFDECTGEYVRQCVYVGDRVRLRTFINSDKMLADYYRGHRTNTIEYRETDAKGDIRWLRLTVDLVEYPTSKDVQAYLMFEDIDRHKKEELLTIKLSKTDPLTGVLNRTAFIERMEKILEASGTEEKHALVMLDIDNFKSINDSLGHGAGDTVLRELTAKTNTVLGKNDFVGRIGGDEFLAFLTGIQSREEIEKKAKEICALKIRIKDTDAVVTASIGITVVPDDGNDFDTLYKKVDSALYKAKESGKNNYIFYDKKA